MNRVQELEVRRERLLEAMEGIRSVNRGSVTEQYYEVKLQGKSESVLRGPYYVLSRNDKGKTVSVRVKREQVQAMKEDVAQYVRLKELFREFAEVTEQLGQVERMAGNEKKASKRRCRSRSPRS